MCRSQTYDGAGNMSGKVKGAAATFYMETGNDKAVYFHCASHQLNLCLSKASKVPQVFNMISTMQVLGIFFKYSPKRQRKLEASISELASEHNLKYKIKPLCETRWVERHTAFEDLFTLYAPLLHCLESIQNNSDPENQFDPKSVTEASGLSKQLRSPSFIISFQTCYYLFGYTKGLSKQLQGSTIEILKADEMVSLLVTNQLNEVFEFKAIFDKCETMANLSNVILDVPRTVSRQTLRANVEHDTPEEYYRRSIFVPFIDSLLQQLNDRFQGKAKDGIKGMFLVPSNLENIDAEKISIISIINPRNHISQIL